MTEDLSIAADVLLRRLAPLVSQDAQLLAVLRDLAQQFLALTEAYSPPAVAVEVVAGEPAVTEVALPAPAQHVALPSAPGIEIPVSWFRRILTADGDLQLIDARCRLKAEGARWAAARRRSLQDGVDYYAEIEPRDREIISKAKTLEDCFLWMNHSSAPVPADLRLWDDVAGCFEAAAMAVAVLRQVIENGEKYRGFLEKAVDLAAEAQSALRGAVEMVDGKPDSDQFKIFHWLRRVGTRSRSPSLASCGWTTPPTRPDGTIYRSPGQLDSEIEAVRQQDKQRVKLLKKAQYHAQIIGDGRGTEADWTKVIDAVNTLVGGGMPASNTELRNMLAPDCRRHSRSGNSRRLSPRP